MRTYSGQSILAISALIGVLATAHSMAGCTPDLWIAVESADGSSTESPSIDVAFYDSAACSGQASLDAGSAGVDAGSPAADASTVNGKGGSVCSDPSQTCIQSGPLGQTCLQYCGPDTAPCPAGTLCTRTESCCFSPSCPGTDTFACCPPYGCTPDAGFDASLDANIVFGDL
jgi:hypothetical protein